MTYWKGIVLLEKISKDLNIEVAFTSGFREYIDKAVGKVLGEILYLRKMIKLPWQNDLYV